MSTLLNPLMLFGVLFASVPLIIHLLNKNRYRTVSFGAMMFLEAAVKSRARRIKLQQLILLLLRMFFFLFIALALARPVFTPKDGQTIDTPTTLVIIIDGSYSMHQGTGEDNAFFKAKETALKILDDMKKSDNMLIIWAGSRPKLLFDRPSFDKDYLREKIMSLKVGYEVLNVQDALRSAFWALESSRLPKSRIYVLTDSQKEGWKMNFDKGWQEVVDHKDVLKIKPNIYVFTQSPSSTIENISIRSVKSRSEIVDTFRTTTFLVELDNHTKGKESIHIKLLVDGELKRETDLLLKPGVNIETFDFQFDKPGSHYVSVEISDDDLMIDNDFTKAIHVMETIPVLLIQGPVDSNSPRINKHVIRYALEASGGAIPYRVIQRD
ncbi:BatA domain-containing protein [bacterium AH-315-E10]|nr:BatA domain-containing protein [bacterium AH-315-E10]